LLIGCPRDSFLRFVDQIFSLPSAWPFLFFGLLIIDRIASLTAVVIMRLYSDNSLDSTPVESSRPAIVADSLTPQYSAESLASVVPGRIIFTNPVERPDVMSYGRLLRRCRLLSSMLSSSPVRLHDHRQ
jgi:hypothetical protein